MPGRNAYLDGLLGADRPNNCFRPNVGLLKKWAHYYGGIPVSDTNFILTPEQAESLLPPGERVHSFVNPPWGFVGCDSSRTAVVRLIREAKLLEIGGAREADEACARRPCSRGRVQVFCNRHGEG